MNVKDRCVPSVLLVAALAAILHSDATAQEPIPPDITAIRVGFDGYYKLGVWTPVQISVRGGDFSTSGVVRVTASDAEGVETVVESPREVQVSAGEETVVNLHARIGRDDRLTVEFVAADARDTHTLETGGNDSQFLYRAAIEPQHRLFVILGRGLNGDELTHDSAGAQRDGVFVAIVTNVDHLPRRWIDYEGVSTLLVTTSAPEMFTRMLPNSATLTAIRDWLQMGGKLFLCTGAESPRILGQDQPWEQFSPGEFVSAQPMRSADSLEQFTDEGFPPIDADSPPIAVLRNVSGKIELKDKETPLVVRSAQGLGEVTFVAVDLDSPPFSTWRGRRRLLERLLLGDAASKSLDQVNNSVARMYGFSDLAGQLRGALDQFRGVKPAPFALVGGLVLVYIILIGPGDYFFLKKVLRRMELTWITFPLTAGGFCVLAYVLAYEYKGSNLHVNQVDLIDVDVQSGDVRGTTWVSIFSPSSQSFDFSLAPRVDGSGATAGMPVSADNSAPEVVFGWLGNPGDGLGGMSSDGPRASMFRRGYRYSDNLATMEGVSIPVWSSGSYTSRWKYRGLVGFSANLQRVPTGQLEGTLTMPPDLSMDDCLLAFGKFAYQFPNLSAGQSVKIERGDETGLADALKNVRLANFDEKTAVWGRAGMEYDQAGQDPPTIVRRMMFFEAADAERNTGMSNGYQAFTDLSKRLDLDRAILMGRVKTNQSAAQLIDRGQPLEGAQDQYWVYCRFVVPVKPPSEDSAAAVTPVESAEPAQTP